MVLSLGILILVSYFILNHYYTSLNKSKQEVLHRLMAIAQTGALLVDGDVHDSLARHFTSKDAIKTNDQDSTYQKLHGILQHIKTVNHLETPLYTIVFYPADRTFHFIVTSSDQPYFRHVYKNYPKALLDNLETGGTLDSYHDENGQWLSAFAPIKNKQGNVVALLEADENFEAFAMRARHELWQNMILSILIVIPFGLLLYNYFARTFRKHETDQEMLLQQKEEIEAQNEEIKAQSDLIEIQNRDLERRVEERTAELQVTNEQLANFLYHSSHDVQAPIATLKGLEQLLAFEVISENGKEYVRRMQSTTVRLDQIVKTIQKVHHIKTMKPSLHAVNLEELVHRAFQMVPHPRGKIQVAASAHVQLHSDSELLGIILTELFKNAGQFNSHHTHLTIGVKLVQKDSDVCLEIHNNGEKISHAAQQNLFVMFKRGHEHSHGIGLGLYIASVCAQRLGGRLTHDNDRDEGVAFLLWLPAITRASQEEETAAHV